MDNTKVWLPIMAIIFAVGGLFLYRHLDLVDRANNDLLTTRAILESTRETAAQRKGAYEQQRVKVETASLKVRTAQETLAAAQKATEEAGKKERSVDGDLRYLAGSMATAVEKVRAAAAGSVVGEVALADGKVLRGVTIRKLEPTGLSLIHSEGFSSVPLEKLPATLIEQYDLGANSLVGQLKALVESTAQPATGKSVNKVAAYSPAREPAPSIPDKPVVDETKLKSLRLKIVDVESRIKAAEASASAFLRQASDNYTNGDIAKSRGTPAAKYWTAAEQAARNAEVYKAQARALDADKKKLEVELEFTLRGGK